MTTAATRTQRAEALTQLAAAWDQDHTKHIAASAERSGTTAAVLHLSMAVARKLCADELRAVLAEGASK